MPAAWHATKFLNDTAPQTPNFAVKSTDKISWIAQNPQFEHDAISSMNQQWRDRLRTLVSVDDIITEIAELLQQYPSVDDNTYIIFSSDHGFHLGLYVLLK